MRALILAVLLGAPLGACQAAGTRVTSVVGIDVVEGVNAVPRFVPDGRQGVIVEGRRSGSSSRAIYLVMVPRSIPDRGWDVVGVSDGAGRIDSGPDSGGPRQRSVRFARAKVGGLPATLMFVATAGAETGRYQIVTYRLVTDGDDGSGLNAVFDPIHTVTPQRAFCSPGEALDDMEDLTPEPGDGCSPTGS